MSHNTILASVAACVLCLATGYCDTHYVSPEGSGEPPYSTPATASRTIQPAVDVARPADTIAIGPGEYHEHVGMTNRLTLLGSGRGATSIWGSIRAGIDAQIEELAVRQDRAQDDPLFSPYAICGPSTGGLTVHRCTISGTFEHRIRLRSHGGFALIEDREIQGTYSPPSPPTLSAGVDSGGSDELVCVIARSKIVRNDRGILGLSPKSELWIMSTVLSGNWTALEASYTDTRVIGCSVDGNIRGITVQGDKALVVQSSTLCHNAEHAVWSGDDPLVELLNCTLARNDTGVALADGTVLARRCIIWGNTSDDVALVDTYGAFSATDSDIGGGWQDEGNIDAEPLFRDPDRGNFRLTSASPCVDPPPSSGPEWDVAWGFDRDGKPRMAYGGKAHRVDMGAYEYYINRLEPVPGTHETIFTWSSLADKTYSIFYSPHLLTWHLVVANFPSAGNETTSWIDDGSLTGVPPSLAPRRFYSVLENR